MSLDIDDATIVNLQNDKDEEVRNMVERLKHKTKMQKEKEISCKTKQFWNQLELQEKIGELLDYTKGEGNRNMMQLYELLNDDD